MLATIFTLAAATSLFNLEHAELVLDPVPHIILHNALPTALFADLDATYPTELLERVSAAARRGEGWSRMDGELVRGDDEFAALLSASPAWAALHEHIASAAFVNAVLRKFNAPLLRRRGDLRVDPHALHFADHIETRAWMGASDVAEAIKRDPAPGGRDPAALFARMDVGVGEVGYSKALHVDWRHRLASAIFYVSDAEANAMEGGVLQFHAPRDPASGDAGGSAAVSLTVKPRANTLLLYLSTARSLHSVTRVVAQTAPRRALYIAVSSASRIWNDCAPAVEECVVSTNEQLAPLDTCDEDCVVSVEVTQDDSGDGATTTEHVVASVARGASDSVARAAFHIAAHRFCGDEAAEEEEGSCAARLASHFLTLWHGGKLTLRPPYARPLRALPQREFHTFRRKGRGVEL